MIAGERRLRAAVKAGWQQVPAQVREADDRQMCEVAIVENLQRKDLNALEKAASFQQYLERYGCTQEELAGRLKIDRSTIANLIRLLELPETIQQAIRCGGLTPGPRPGAVAAGRRARAGGVLPADPGREPERTGHRRAGAAGDPQRRPRAAGRGGRRGAESQVAQRGGEHAHLEHELRTALGTKVEIKHRASGRGQIVIHFAHADEFERLRSHMAGSVRKKAG